MTKPEAMRLAKKTLKMMKTKGWKIRVWANLGWHFCLVKGNLKLHWCEHDNTYGTLLSLDESPGGEIFWSPPFRFKNPNTAVKVQLKRSEDFIAACQQAVALIKVGS